MPMNKNSAGVILLVCLVGALLGSVCGKLLVLLIPAFGTVLAATTVTIAANLEVIGLSLNFNAMSVVGVVVALVFLRRW